MRKISSDALRRLLKNKAIINLSRFLIILVSVSAVFYAALASISIIYYFGAY
jgi:hypothetical protein